jgi:hypothetical protein
MDAINIVRLENGGGGGGGGGVGVHAYLHNMFNINCCSSLSY